MSSGILYEGGREGREGRGRRIEKGENSGAMEEAGRGW